MPECSKKLRLAGMAAPRTCYVCGLGPCSEQVEQPERYETRDIVLLRGQQLRITAGSRTLYVYVNRAGLHVSDNRDGEKGKKKKCIACGGFALTTGCERVGCPSGRSNSVRVRADGI